MSSISNVLFYYFLHLVICLIISHVFHIILPHHFILFRSSSAKFGTIVSSFEPVNSDQRPWRENEDDAKVEVSIHEKCEWSVAVGPKLL